MVFLTRFRTDDADKILLDLSMDNIEACSTVVISTMRDVSNDFLISFHFRACNFKISQQVIDSLNKMPPCEDFDAATIVKDSFNLWHE